MIYSHDILLIEFNNKMISPITVKNGNKNFLKKAAFAQRYWVQIQHKGSNEAMKFLVFADKMALFKDNKIALLKKLLHASLQNNRSVHDKHYKHTEIP